MRVAVAAACIAIVMGTGGAIASAKDRSSNVFSSSDGYVVTTYRRGEQQSFGSPVDCSYAVQTLGIDSIDSSGTRSVIASAGVERIDDNGIGYRSGADGEADLKLLFRSGADCTDGLIWVSTGLTAASLLPALTQRLERTLPLPVPNISPDPSIGSFANLGLWVAIDDPGVIIDRLTDGPVWAEARATLTGFRIDYGVEDAFDECTGTGTPYPEGSNDPDEGPCGYTYTQRSPDDSPYQITITSHYDVTYTLSAGDPGTLGTIDRASTPIAYDVDEVQVIGTGR